MALHRRIRPRGPALDAVRLLRVLNRLQVRLWGSRDEWDVFVLKERYRRVFRWLRGLLGETN